MEKVTKLFTLEATFVSVEDSEDGIFSVPPKSAYGARTYYDSVGKEIEWKAEVHKDNQYEEIEDWGECSDDPTADSMPPRDGRYVYTTHEIEYWGPDRQGHFGIKDLDGNIVVPEQFEDTQGFCNGLCSVQSWENHKWGFIDTTGRLVIDYKFPEHSEFNQYGVALGDNHLIDKAGNNIPGTLYNGILEAHGDLRYFIIDFETEEELAEDKDEFTHCDIYDTKNREYVAKRVPADIEISCCDDNIEKGIIREAIKYMDGNTKVEVLDERYFACESGGYTTVYKFEKKI